MAVTVWSAAWFAPFVLPLCFWVAWSDLSVMRIPNKSVLLLFGIFLVVGLIALPFETYLWRIAGAAIVFGIGVILYMFGGIGAGDIKFAAAMAPFFSGGDLSVVLFLFASVLLAAVATHQAARRIPAIRGLVPGWKSWESRNFPMGLALTGTLGFYLLLGLWVGS